MTCSAGCSPMRGWSIRATPPIRCAPSSTATSRTASPPPRRTRLFFTLELNRIDDDVLERAMQEPALGHYRPWIEDVRKEKPYQLEDRIEQLFHEKSVTGYSAWNRLFDETIASLRFKVEGKSLRDRADAQPAAGPDEKKRKAAAEALAKTFKENLRAVHPRHQHARQGQGDFRPLARFSRRRCRAAPVQSGRARGGRRAGRRGARGLSAPVAPLLRA